MVYLEKNNKQRMCKLSDDNFSRYMQYDIVCLSETHAKSKDALQYEGYKCYMNCWEMNYRNQVGVLQLLVKEISYMVFNWLINQLKICFNSN